MYPSLGPSNSAKKLPCQRPRTSLPSSTKTKAFIPTSMVFTWASELPSAWRYGPAERTSRSRAPSASEATSGSACSLMRMPAVVCGTYRYLIPPERRNHPLNLMGNADHLGAPTGLYADRFHILHPFLVRTKMPARKSATILPFTISSILRG
jgi:hypothetical protein